MVHMYHDVASHDEIEEIKSNARMAVKFSVLFSFLGVRGRN